MNFIKRTLATALISVIFVTLVFGNITAHADPDTSEINENNITLIGRMDMTALQELLDESGTCLQNFSRYGATNIYFFTASRNNDTYIIRCSLSSNVFTPLDFYVLEDYGHGESIEVTGYDVTSFSYTIWIGSGLSNGGWSKYVSRIKYKIDNQSSTGASVDSTKTKTITGLIDAATGTTGNSEYRTTVCISSSSDNRICFTTRKTINDVNGIFNMVYTFSSVDYVLENMTGSTIALSSLSSYQQSLFWIPKSEAYPNNSFQGEETTGTGTSNGMLYISGGSTYQDGKINQFQYTDTNGYELKKIYTVKTTTAGSTHDIKNAEIEGIKIYKSGSTEYMFMLFRKPDGDNDKHSIYRYTIS